MNHRVLFGLCIVLATCLGLVWKSTLTRDKHVQAALPETAPASPERVHFDSATEREIVEPSPEDGTIGLSETYPAANQVESAPADPAPAMTFADNYAGRSVDELETASKAILLDIRRIREDLVAKRLEQGNFEVRDISLPVPTPAGPGEMVSMGGKIGADSNGQPVLHHVTIQPGESPQLDALQAEYVWLAATVRALRQGGK